MCVALVVFFFQAEDGIRDGRVTGVQTCALPISRGRGTRTSTPTTAEGCAVRAACGGRCRPAATRGRRRARCGGCLQRPLPPRSEERRVGKECRSRWSP